MTGSIDVQLFWVAFLFYFLGWLTLTGWIAVRKAAWLKVGTVLFVLGFLPQTAAFILRWIHTGHYPMSNMYEYMMVMSWMAVVSFGVLSYRYRNWLVSALISPVVVMLMVAAALLPKDPSQQLMPALQSKWLMIHVSLASIGAGAFAVAAAVSLIYLIGVRTSEDKKLEFKPSLRIPLQILLIVPAILAIVGSTTEVFASQSSLQLFARPTTLGSTLILLGIYLPFAGFAWSRVSRLVTNVEKRYWAALGFMALFAGAIASGLIIRSGQLQLSENSPLRIFEFFGATLILGTLSLMVLHAVMAAGRLPAKLQLDGKLLDEINYRAVTLGYPLYTIGALFAGAIWAESAWGSFWSWDPKEVGALIIWLFFSAYLHARYQRGWTGTRTAVLSLIGFAMMMLSFFGNYFFGGLHSYN